MNKCIKNALIFSSGAAVGFSAFGLIAIKKVISSKYFKPVIRDVVKDKVDHFLYGEDRQKKTMMSYHDGRHVEAIVSSREEAETVLSRMDEIMEDYGIVRVSDLYDLIGIDCDYITNLYGWTDISDFFIQRVRLGYEIVVSKPKRIS